MQVASEGRGVGLWGPDLGSQKRRTSFFFLFSFPFLVGSCSGRLLFWSAPVLVGFCSGRLLFWSASVLAGSCSGRLLFCPAASRSRRRCSFLFSLLSADGGGDGGAIYA